VVVSCQEGKAAPHLILSGYAVFLYSRA
jgi:hypothetical protein